MLAGMLNRRVVITQQSTDQDDYGQPVQTWTEVATCWANIANKSGLQTILSDAQDSEVHSSIRIRYRTDIEPGMRLSLPQFPDLVFQVQAVMPDHAGRVFTDLVCLEVQ
jgi:SPP1 family predicted phage head-tail adaptor